MVEREFVFEIFLSLRQSLKRSYWKLCVTNFSSSEICFSASIGIIFSLFDAFFVKRETTVYQKVLLSVIFFFFFVLRPSKYGFLVFLNSFLHKFHKILYFSLLVWLLSFKNFIIALWSSIFIKGASFAGRYFFLIVCVFIEHAKDWLLKQT